jgi:type 1 glutamine amidotransferase
VTRRACILLLATALAVCVSGARAAGMSGQTRVVLLYGGCCHPWEQQTQAVRTLLETGTNVRVTPTDDRESLRKETLEQFGAVLIMTQGGGITDEQLAGLLGFVRDGGGLIVLHAGSGAFRESGAAEYFRMLGGKFRSHRYGDFRVELTGDHPVTRGLAGFEVRDEDYVHDLYPDVDRQVLAVRASDGEPVSWVRRHGRGRVFYLALGHDRHSWNNRHFQILLYRGTLWAAGDDRPGLPQARIRLPE